MKKLALFLNVIILSVIFNIPKLVLAQQESLDLGCCKFIDDNYACIKAEANVKASSCVIGGSWSSGECPLDCKIINTPQSDDKTVIEGCKFEGNGEEKCQLKNPIGVGVQGTTEVPALIKQVIKVALGVIGSFTLLMFVWGGFQWLTSAGNPEKVSAGTQTMVWAVIGVMVVFASYVLLSTFLNIFVHG